ncbi:transposase [Marinococcus sp. PL1-022]|uniref:transposase n=1 Tax=Marinococcus sp. PL1-022 TaxID=3095363 RepID=UPI0029C46B7F|nr:transposase [Marinococcus sp. PL1-022]MDX6152660.1 transposase [Marinococcus sp. PL1-022]
MQKLLEGWTREHRNGSVKALQEAANHDAHHSSVTRFFRTSRVDDHALERKLQRSVLQHLQRQASSANRVLDTAPMPLPARDWAQRARQVEDPDLVTVRITTYEMVRFQGRLKGGLSGVVVGSRASASHEAYRFFFSTDSSMTAEDVLSWYQNRWAIETFFQEAKGKLSMGGYRLRIASAIRRYLLLLQTVGLDVCGYHQRSLSCQSPGPPATGDYGYLPARPSGRDSGERV